MKFSSLSNPNTRIRLAPGVSQLTVNSELQFLKHNNRLFKISGNSQNDFLLKIFKVLRQPKNFSQIQDSLSHYRRKDLSDLLFKLHQLQLLEFEQNTDKDDVEPVLRHSNVRSKYKKKERHVHNLKGSQILLIGNGVLANKLRKRLENNKLNCISMSSDSVLESILKQVPNSQSIKVKRIDSQDSFLSSLVQSRLIIGAEDFPNISFFEKLNKLCIEQKKPWIRVCFDDKIGYVGPFVIPGKSSCFLCCELRIVTNSPLYERQLWKYKEFIPQSELAVSELFVDILSAFCANEVETYLKGFEPNTIDNMYTFDTRQMELSKHKIIAHPNCEFGSLSLKKKQDLSKRKGGTPSFGPDSDSEKILTHGELLERLKVIQDEKTGIVVDSGKVYDTNPLGIDFHHFSFVTLYRPLRMGFERKANASLESEDNLLIPSPSGSGSTPDEARLHAIMESVERYSNMIVDESRFKWFSYNDVKNKAINPMDLGLYKEEHYDRNPSNYSRFSPSSKIPWIEGHDLSAGRTILVPADFVHYPAFRQKPLVRDTSNGSASHSNTIEAILSGLYEVMERDAFLVMWMNRISVPIVELKSLPFGFGESIKLINEFGMRIKLLDLTNDIGIPTVAAVCYNSNPHKYPAMLVGTGTHIDPMRAVQKALAEMELILIDTLENPDRERIAKPDEITSMYKHTLFYLNPQMRKYWQFMISSQRKNVLPTLAEASFKDNKRVLMWMVKKLNSLNYRTIWVDITSPDIRNLGLKVVKVLVTGLQPLYMGPGVRVNTRRLADAPPRLGYKASDLSHLNPAPHPLP
jgi:ribosomal protein S12 methylthiotransferase accessory factor